MFVFLHLLQLIFNQRESIQYEVQLQQLQLSLVYHVLIFAYMYMALLQH